MAINFKDVKQTLYNWVITQVPLGMPVIFYMPNSPRPEVPYISLYLNSITQVNRDYAATNSDSFGVVNMKGDRQFTVQVQGYGNDPLTVLENIRTSLQKQSVLDILRSGGIVYYSSLGINDITALIDSQFEQRAQLDLSMGIAQIYTDDPGYFDTIEVEEIISDQIDVVIYDQIITLESP